MKFLALVSVVCAVAVAHAVVRFSASGASERNEYDLFRILKRLQTSERYASNMHVESIDMHPPTKLTKFVVKNCGDPKKESAIVVNLQVTPDPIEIPGNIGLTFTLDNLKLAQAPLKTDVKIEKKFLKTWISVPCIDQFGSCHYDDFCEILSLITQCPDPFIQAGIPCQCPFKVANYTLPQAEFQVSTSLLPAGNYFGQLNMTMAGNPVTCFQVYLTFA